MTTFPQFARQKRISAGLSQWTVSQALGYQHRNGISRLESGAIEWRLEHLFAFAELLGVTASELLKEYENADKGESWGG